MTEYWIIIDGNQNGPFSADQVRDMNLPASTPVWRQGLLDWTTLGALPDFADPAPAIPPPPIPQPDLHPWAQPRMQAPMQPQGSFKTQPYQGTAPSATPDRGPAPTYLAWSIVVTLLCCVVLGVVSIIYAAKVSAANERGDYDRAWRISRNVELWIIAAFTLGLISLPFSVIFQLASMQ